MTKLDVWKCACLLFLLCAGTAIASHAQTFTTILNFDGTNGRGPFASLIQATNGKFYSTTASGGETQFCRSCGEIFSVTMTGDLTTHNFCGQVGCSDGRDPGPSVVQATDGNFYGVTSSGGANQVGTVFKITPGGSFPR